MELWATIFWSLQTDWKQGTPPNKFAIESHANCERAEVPIPIQTLSVFRNASRCWGAFLRKEASPHARRTPERKPEEVGSQTYTKATWSKFFLIHRKPFKNPLVKQTLSAGSNWKCIVPWVQKEKTLRILESEKWITFFDYVDSSPGEIFSVGLYPFFFAFSTNFFTRRCWKTDFLFRLLVSAFGHLRLFLLPPTFPCIRWKPSTQPSAPDLPRPMMLILEIFKTQYLEKKRTRFFERNKWGSESRKFCRVNWKKI